MGKRSGENSENGESMKMVRFYRNLKQKES
jgi:hypothetical protein